MIISKFANIYILADIGSFTVLLISLYFAVLSYIPAIDVRKTQYRKNLALVFLYVGLWIKVVLWFYWYFMLEGMVISASGERCILCLLSKAGSLSWLVGTLKIVSFPVILYCLGLRFIDKSIKSRPFMNRRVGFILFAVPVLLFEIAADIIMQKKVMSAACDFASKVFKLHMGAAWGKLTGYNGFWIFMFFLFVLILLAGLFILLKFSNEDAYYLNFRKIILTQVGVAVSSTVMIFSFLLAVHNELCPLFLDIENHCCIFCLLQYSFDLPISFFLLLIGFGLSCSLGLMPHLKSENGAGEARNKPIFIDKYQSIVKTSFVIISSGAVIILIRLVEAVIGS